MSIVSDIRVQGIQRCPSYLSLTRPASQTRPRAVNQSVIVMSISRA